VLAQIHLAHPAGADEVEDLVLVGEEEPVGAALLKLAGLERRQQAVFNQALGGGIRVGGVGVVRLQLGGGEEAAVFDQRPKLGGSR
jgi:hypothetical protein